MTRFTLFVALFILPIIAASQNEIDQEYLQKLVDSSTYFYNTGNYSKSLEFNIKIVKGAQKINDTSYLQSGYRYLGYDYLVLADTLQAKDNFEKSREFASLSKNKSALGLSYMDLANLYRFSENALEKAVDYHDKSISVFREIKDTLNLSAAYYNTVLTLIDFEKYDRAYSYLLKADGLKYYLDNSLRAGIQNQWALYYLEKEDYEKVDYYLSDLFLDQTLADYYFDIAEGYLYYSRSLSAQGRYKEAYENVVKYQELYEKNQQKLQSEESQKIAASFQLSQYRKDIEKNELTNKLQSEIVESKSKLNTFLIIIVIASLLLLGVLFIAFKARYKYIKDLKVKNQEYLKAKEESEKLSQSKAQFFSTISHELRTPLYGVIGLTNILMDDPTLKSHEQDIKSLKFSADYLLALINDVLQVSKLDSKSVKEELSVFDVRELVRIITASFEYMRIQNKNTIEIDIEPDVPQFVEGDSVRLSQVLMNLIGNACKFTENGLIRISLSNISEEKDVAIIHFSIKDDGVGIPKERQERIFDEFSQIGSKHYTYQGTGLGLPIVKKLLALHDSEIKLDSEYGEGSDFHFTLRFKVMKDHTADTAKSTSLVTEEYLENKKILIVDDNRINQKVTQKILEKSKVDCTIANNGEEAYIKAKNHTYDLILMDVNMPVMNGLEATLEIRKFDTKIPIIALTAVEVREMRNEIFSSGMNDIIVKPYDVNIFKRTILKNLKRGVA